ncbi:MAG: peptidase T [Bacteroidetes bacterium GWC2_33_15]|nr:MAG: peptidase T [Bacteroidetes bacterium GWA2_33_15]OFX51057.1 MAG: peptidase T [Bacteroidetes bacterium GWC2_33_15]OFX66510.1 MAG: peptidase T [Bacteroidetes bacterium GWB2_32_14]OFX70265.1 MAG: peptidase T [Bacteroidetes bacterium GWD2_33_33]HAN17262.1 peptidase T [Bacteroidales bacterium]
MKKSILNRFLKYVQIDTQSDEDSQTFPSTKKQFDLAYHLEKELKQLGLKNVDVDTYGYVTATLPSNTDKKIPTIGFLAHMDTAPDMSGENVKPQVFENYNGKNIPINTDLDICLSVKEFPELKNYIGQTIITASGKTLLGADDKAGIAEIMTAMEYLGKHPEIKHGTIKVAFTPDEEVGKGVDFFDVKKFGADYAYTVDGGPIGELEYENFNAASAKIKIQGRNIHPGYAKDKMINAILIATEINEMLPKNERPELTENYEGFFHITKLNGTVEEAEIQYIIRDHDKSKFENKKAFIQNIVESINKKYNQPITGIEIKDQYYNMREKIEPVMHIVEKAKQAMIEVGVKPEIKPVRGGTDGARLSYMGLPCPNIFTGGHNYHGKYEYAVLESMEKSVQVILRIIENSARTD